MLGMLASRYDLLVDFYGKTIATEVKSLDQLGKHQIFIDLLSVAIDKYLHQVFNLGGKFSLRQLYSFVNITDAVTTNYY